MLVTGVTIKVGASMVPPLIQTEVGLFLVIENVGEVAAIDGNTLVQPK